jgi:SARP family transcriptional regulator, regulator of embCAB operon
VQSLHSPGVATDPKIFLIPTFQCLVDGQVISLPPQARKVLAMVALERRAVRREVITARMWPGLRESQALPRLRQTVWRIGREAGAGIVAATRESIGLADAVEVDFVRATECVRTLLRGGRDGASVRHRPVESWQWLCRELLEEYDDEWLLPVREQWRRDRVLALERLAAAYLAQGERYPAIELAGAAVRIDPLWEPAQHLLVLAYAQTQNPVAALRAVETYRQRLRRELGLTPGPAITDLVARLRRNQRLGA